MDIKAELVAEAVKIVTGERRAAYGTPEQNFARIARLWNGHLMNRDIIDADAVGITPADVATFMRLMKEARLAETPAHRDSYVDILGYALCGAELALAVRQIPISEAIERVWDDSVGTLVGVNSRHIPGAM